MDTVAWLYGLQKLGVKLGLDGIRALLEIADRPDRAFPSILVAGTNGKGSVAAMLDAMLRASGRRTGLYTSPHLVRPNERIRIDGADVDDATLEAGLARVRAYCELGLADARLAAHPSFFEVMTVAALESFRDARVDVAVLEVGLGGRLDATNATEPVAGVITTIGIDHVAQLGASLESIAAEKAHVARKGRPLVTGVTQPAPLGVIRDHARAVGALLVEAHAATLPVDPGEVGLSGAHQRDNARVALVAFERLAAEIGLSPDPRAMREGLRSVRWPARLQWIDGRPAILVDGAHNEDGAQALAAHLDGLRRGRPVLLCAAMRDKDPARILGPIVARSAAVVVARPGVERAADPEELAARLAHPGLPVEACAEVGAALRRACELAGPTGWVLVAGSLYLAGDVLRTLQGGEGAGPVAM
ncbi:MAG TPA: folylpolyglutamate synthase/dihydrofolate synthase family protein [Candidatus Polarisedimenticolaceae bacterium]